MQERITLDEMLEPDEIMERAYSRMGEKDYDLLFNKCENFATWCRCG